MTLFRHRPARFTGALISLMLASDPASAQSLPLDTLTLSEISKESKNPITQFATLPIDYRADFRDNRQGDTESQLFISDAILPLSLNRDWALVLRTKLPYVWQPPKTAAGQWTDGLGNGYTQFFLSPAHGHGFYWGIGPSVGWPASNRALGTTAVALGPAVAAYHKDESRMVYGFVAQNLWATGPIAPGNGYNEMQVKLILAYELGDGWAIGSSPTIKANWLAKTGQQWTVPAGLTLSKAERIGGQPIEFGINAYYNAVRPQAATDPWYVQASVKFLFAAPN